MQGIPGPTNPPSAPTRTQVPVMKAKSAPTKLSMVGKALDNGGAGGAWEFQGVFDTEAAAIAACRTKDYFIGPANLNEEHPHEVARWQGAYYPHLEQKPSSEGDPHASDPGA